VLHRRLRSPDVPELDFEAIRTELEVPGPFDPAALEAAEQAARQPPPGDRVDATDLELVTIDPPGSMDLDQAVAIQERSGGGWTVHYAIADVAAWVTPGDPIDGAARARTQTYYSPDTRTPLHPPALGEAAASLLPDGPRPAVLWSIDVEPDGSTARVEVRRAMVRSRAKLDYAGVQADLDAGRAPEVLQAFPALGAALLADARARHAIDLGLPEQEVVAGPDGTWTVALRNSLPVETWNAQVSLLTGRAAAAIMIEGGIGILRTLPAPDPADLPRLQRKARGLGVDWPDGADPGAVLAGLDLTRPRHLAFADLASELLRGAGYTALGVPLPPPADSKGHADLGHAGVGGPYAHVTAPLRRLVDRFATETCLALTAGIEVPDWVEEGLATCPALMADGDGRARKLERANVDATEAFVLHDRVGDVFAASVVETGDKYGTVMLDEPAVRGRCDTRDLPLGADVHVRCTEADVAARTVRFERVS
jgi:exoribonuclease R